MPEPINPSDFPSRNEALSLLCQAILQIPTSLASLSSQDKRHLQRFAQDPSVFAGSITFDLIPPNTCPNLFRSGNLEVSILLQNPTYRETLAGDRYALSSVALSFRTTSQGYLPDLADHIKFLQGTSAFLHEVSAPLSHLDLSPIVFAQLEESAQDIAKRQQALADKLRQGLFHGALQKLIKGKPLKPGTSRSLPITPFLDCFPPPSFQNEAVTVYTVKIGSKVYTLSHETGKDSLSLSLTK